MCVCVCERDKEESIPYLFEIPHPRCNVHVLLQLLKNLLLRFGPAYKRAAHEVKRSGVVPRRYTIQKSACNGTSAVVRTGVCIFMEDYGTGGDAPPIFQSPDSMRGVMFLRWVLSTRVMRAIL